MKALKPSNGEDYPPTRQPRRIIRTMADVLNWYNQTPQPNTMQKEKLTTIYVGFANATAKMIRLSVNGELGYIYKEDLVKILSGNQRYADIVKFKPVEEVNNK